MAINDPFIDTGNVNYDHLIVTFDELGEALGLPTAGRPRAIGSTGATNGVGQ